MKITEVFLEEVGKYVLKVVVKGALQRVQRRAELWRTLDIYENYVKMYAAIFNSLMISSCKNQNCF